VNFALESKERERENRKEEREKQKYSLIIILFLSVFSIHTDFSVERIFLFLTIFHNFYYFCIAAGEFFIL